MGPSPSSALRRILLTPLTVALLLVLGASLLAAAASAAPRDDVGGAGDDPGVVVDESTETPLPEVEPEPTPVAIPSVSPEPETTPDPFDVTGPLDGGVLDPGVPTGSSDLHITFEVCNSPVAGQIADLWCGPAPFDGYTGYVYRKMPNNTYELAYEGAYPTTLFDLPAGLYLVATGPPPPSMRLTTICREEDQAGTVLQTFDNLFFDIGYELVYRCTIYQTADAGAPGTVQRSDGPTILIVKDFVCPPGTDPSLNFFGLIGRCQQVESGTPYEVTNPAGAYESKETQGDGNVTFDVFGGTSWTVTRVQNASPYLPPVLYCNVRDDLLQEPDRYAPFMTYTSGPEGAVLPLEQGMTWICGAYSIPTDPGDGSDTIQVSVTSRVCPEGTQAPTAALCAETLAGVTVHLLAAGETIVATNQTGPDGSVAFAAPENLITFGLAEDVPSGFAVADVARCSVDGGAPTDLAVDQLGIVDLGELTGGQTVACDWFNVADSSATAPAPLTQDRQVVDIDAPELTPDVEGGEIEPRDDGGQEVGDPEVGDPDGGGPDDGGPDDAGDADPTETPDSGGIVPLEEE